MADENESEIEVDTPPESEIEVDSADPKIVEIDTTSVWDQNKIDIAKAGPKIKLSTDYNRKVKAAKKNKKQVSQKKKKKKIGQINTQNKASKDWLKLLGILTQKIRIK